MSLTNARRRLGIGVAITLAALLMAVGTQAPAQGFAGQVVSHQKISDTEGGFNEVIFNGASMGHALASLDDLNGDGVTDMAMGANGVNDGANQAGAVFILFMETDRTVRATQRISATSGGFTGTLDIFDQFGRSVTNLGDLDDDGVQDLAVGAHGDDDGGNARGAVWILFLNTDGTVKGHAKISSTEGGLVGPLDDEDRFGEALTCVGDLDGDGVPDLVVGASRDDDGGPEPYGDSGAVYVLFLERDGSVKAEQKISVLHGGFTGDVDEGDFFGHAVGSLGDLDGDDVTDLAVGAPHDYVTSPEGAVWILFLDTDGTVKSHQKISSQSGGFSGDLFASRFGDAVATAGDLDRDGVVDLVVGASIDDDGGENCGAAWAVFLHTDGTVKAEQKISVLHGGFGGDLDPHDRFGWAACLLGDLDDDGTLEVAVGAPGDGDGGGSRGAAWVLSLAVDNWHDRGQALGGATGEPALFLDGSLAPNSELVLEVAGATPGSPAVIVAGLAELSMPYMGGVLVPTLDAVIAGLNIGATGALHLEGRWVENPPVPTTLYVQVWIHDAGGPFGLASTNALLGTPVVTP